ncbi:hypothetical protein KIW84_053009 [Lathyrus oleraceus]|uniref:glucan endo-1,3-beta-D-glucosidase n=1 Tax=Pisum sativum TaxID=3888 RepID=A0A9D5AI62_PEA|nr:hypothetical protein KIW84_053009 [Pisum sativum]
MYNAGAFVGVNIGTNVSDLPSASNIVAILKSHQINHVRLYDANPHMLQALSNTGVEAIVIQVMDHVYLQEGENVNHLYINYYELELQVNFYILIKLTLGLNIFKSVLMQAVVVMRAFLLWHLDL